MLQYVFRFTVDRGKAGEFIEWLRANEENFKEHARPGWTYLGTWMTVGVFGSYDGESRWELDGYESLGSDFGDEMAVGLLKDFINSTDNVHREANLLRSVSTVNTAY
jgi:hypothetical protein